MMGQHPNIPSPAQALVYLPQFEGKGFLPPVSEVHRPFLNKYCCSSINAFWKAVLQFWHDELRSQKLHVQSKACEIIIIITKRVLQAFSGSRMNYVLYMGSSYWKREDNCPARTGSSWSPDFLEILYQFRSNSSQKMWGKRLPPHGSDHPMPKTKSC